MAGALHFGDINDLAARKRAKTDKTLVNATAFRRGETHR
jgi:hypothetical protein